MLIQKPIVTMIHICQDTWRTAVLDYLDKVSGVNDDYLLLSNDTFHPDYKYSLKAEIDDETIAINFTIYTEEDGDDYLIKGSVVTIPNNNDIASEENKERLKELHEEMKVWIIGPALYYQSVMMSVIDNINISSDPFTVDEISLSDGSVAHLTLDQGQVTIVHESFEGEMKTLSSVSMMEYEGFAETMDLVKEWVFNWVLGDM